MSPEDEIRYATAKDARLRPLPWLVPLHAGELISEGAPVMVNAEGLVVTVTETVTIS